MTDDAKGRAALVKVATWGTLLFLGPAFVAAAAGLACRVFRLASGG